MKKIKVMSLIWSMGAGGAQQVVINYLRDFHNDPDIEFVLYVYTTPTNSKYDREIAEKGYNVVYLNNPQTKVQIPYIKRFFQRPISQKTWTNAIKKYHPDVVHVHISELLANTLPGIVSSQIPIRFDTLHSNPYRYKGKIKNIIVDSFLNQNVIPICITDEQVLQAKDWYGIKKYEVLHNGVDIERIQRKIISKDIARKKLGIDKNAFVIAGVGRLHPIKRFDLLIEAFETVKKTMPNACLIIAGDGQEKDRLMQLAFDSGLGKNVCFLGNIDNVVDLYCSSDVLAITSYTEASPLVAIEAQACGLRCVVSDGVPSESIVLSSSRKLHPNATIAEWADALLDNDYEGKAYANLDDYEVHRMSRKLKNIYLRYYADYLGDSKCQYRVEKI